MLVLVLALALVPVLVPALPRRPSLLRFLTPLHPSSPATLPLLPEVPPPLAVAQAVALLHQVEAPVALRLPVLSLLCPVLPLLLLAPLPSLDPLSM